jgi:hypothetical protein
MKKLSDLEQPERLIRGALKLTCDRYTGLDILALFVLLQGNFKVAGMEESKLGDVFELATNNTHGVMQERDQCLHLILLGNATTLT